MKNLKDYILKEMEGGCATVTPCNTRGMGNPMAPGMDGTPGTEPLVTNRTAKTKKEKKNASKSTIK